MDRPKAIVCSASLQSSAAHNMPPRSRCAVQHYSHDGPTVVCTMARRPQRFVFETRCLEPSLFVETRCLEPCLFVETRYLEPSLFVETRCVLSCASTASTARCNKPTHRWPTDIRQWKLADGHSPTKNCRWPQGIIE